MATTNGGKICVCMKVEIISTLGSVGRSDQHKEVEMSLYCSDEE